MDTVLVGGDVLLAHKKLTRLDEDDLREQVERINRRVLPEIGIDPRPRLARALTLRPLAPPPP